MKIMLASDTYPPDVNGAANFTARLGVGLVERGHEVHTLAPSPLGRPYTENRDGVILHRIRSHRYPMVENFQICMPWEARPAIKRIIRQVRPDICHAQAHFICGRYLIFGAHELGLPLVATNHFMPENLVDQIPFIPKFAERWACDLAWRDFGRVFRKADVVTAPTPRAVELLSTSAAKMDGGIAISCGIDAGKFAAASHDWQPNDPPEVLFVGRLDQEKRVNELIQAVALLPEGVACTVQVIGDGSCRDEWEKLTEDLGLAERVTFRGFVSEEELIAAYGHCDIFCIPGVAELQSLVTLEAMSAGKPVLAADAMALPHLCHDGENGFLYQPGDVGQLSRNLATLITDKERRLEMGRASLPIVEGHAIGATLDAFEKLYAETVARKQIEA